ASSSTFISTMRHFSGRRRAARTAIHHDHCKSTLSHTPVETEKSPIPKIFRNLNHRHNSSIHLLVSFAQS
ncbi:hypothetical protein VIGAN_02076900, partial [Vigna angularis var. angularis]